MKYRLLPLLIVAIVFVIGAMPASAKNADLLLSPTRVVLENGKRYATVIVKNTGDGVGRYVLEMVDSDMQGNGGIKILDPGVKAANSALDIVSIAPHTMTLKPDEYQMVRILVKSMSDLPDGEYRSHLSVRITEADLDLDNNKPNVPNSTSVVPKAKLATIIPVIVRKGDTNYTVTIDDAKLVMGGADGQSQPQILMNMSFSGNRSLLGDVKVTHVAPNGIETQLAFFRGIGIYREVSKRVQTVPLDNIPLGLNIHNGTLHVALMSQENEGSKVLAEKVITP